MLLGVCTEQSVPVIAEKCACAGVSLSVCCRAGIWGWVLCSACIYYRTVGDVSWSHWPGEGSIWETTACKINVCILEPGQSQPIKSIRGPRPSRAHFLGYFISFANMGRQVRCPFPAVYSTFICIHLLFPKPQAYP